MTNSFMTNSFMTNSFMPNHQHASRGAGILQRYLQSLEYCAHVGAACSEERYLFVRKP
jgi:hypothetical protein